MARPESDVDPHNMDARPRKRRRKDRSKPKPHPLNAADKQESIERLKSLPANPGVMFEPDKGNGWKVTSPHSDLDLWEAQIAAAFGTNSQSVMRVFLSDLKGLCRGAWDEDVERWKPNEREVNAALAMVNDIQPRNTMEAALAAQMVAVHWMQMRLSADALNNGGMVLERQAAIASKMARTFTMQLEQLRALRGNKKPVKQTIKVTRESHHHQHIHVHRVEGAGESDAQPQEARAATIEGRATLQGPCEVHRLPVPKGRNAG